MTPTMPQRSRCRAALVAAAIVGLPLTGCSSGDGADPSSDTKRVSAVDISFEVPEGWEELDAEELAEGTGGDSPFGEVAGDMGLTLEQFKRMASTVDLMVVSDEGARQGTLANVTVVQAAGPMPNDEQLKSQLMQFGAEVEDISHQQTELGDVAVVVYELDVGKLRVQGEAIVADADDGPVSVAVSAGARETADEIADGILDTLAEAS